MADQGARVDSAQTHYMLGREVIVQRRDRAEITGNATRLANDETGQMGPLIFQVFVIYSTIPNVWVGHRDNLPTITGIGQDFLVSGQRRVKADFAERSSWGAKGVTLKRASIFQYKNSG